MRKLIGSGFKSPFVLRDTAFQVTPRDLKCGLQHEGLSPDSLLILHGLLDFLDEIMPLEGFDPKSS